jgi:hypothetical protein
MNIREDQQLQSTNVAAGRRQRWLKPHKAADCDIVNRKCRSVA